MNEDEKTINKAWCGSCGREMVYYDYFRCQYGCQESFFEKIKWRIAYFRMPKENRIKPSFDWERFSTKTQFIGTLSDLSEGKKE